MIHPTDITKAAVVADLKANGPSWVRDVTCRVLGLSPSATKDVTGTYEKHYNRVYSLLRTLVKNGVVDTRVSDASRYNNQRRGEYYIPDQGEAAPDAAVPEQTERKAAGGPNTVVSSGGVFATREDGTVFRFAPVSGDPNGEWRWQRLPDLPQD